MPKCKYCSNEFTQGRNHPNQSYCSKKCSTQWWYENKHKPAEVRVFVCKGCNSEFKTDHKRQYCTLVCARAYRTRSIDPQKKAEWDQMKKEWRQSERGREKKRGYDKKYAKKPERKLQKKRAMEKWLSNPENRKKFNRDKVERDKKRLKSDPVYRTLHNIRRRLNIWLERKKTGKEKKIGSIRNMVGCTKEEFRKHLEAKFYDHPNGLKMSWSNYGFQKLGNSPKWVIDHIIPLNYFAKNKDISSWEVQCEANHYTNLQPMWFTQNAQKSDKL
jgi:hypothetical protein